MNIKIYQLQFIEHGPLCTPSITLSTFLFLSLSSLNFCCEILIRLIKKSFSLLRWISKPYSHFHSYLYITIYWINSDLKNSACTYRVSGFRLDSQEQNQGTVLWLGSVWCLFLLYLIRTANGTLQYKYN